VAEDGKSVTAVETYLANIEARQSLNAFIHIDPDRARASAEAADASGPALPLYGYVIGVKDNVHVAGMPNTAGTAALRGFVPQTSNTVIAALEGAGAVVIGKTGLHELAFGITSNNFEFGPIRNPVDETRIPGGSSGGSAAAVAGGLVDVAIGTDTGGSARIPAALTGIVGFRPTTGRYANDHITPLSPTRDTIGFFTRTVSDIVLFDKVATNTTIAAEPTSLQGLRLGVPRAHFYENLDPDVAAASDRFLAKLSDAGVELVYADLTDVPELAEKTGFPIVLFEAGRELPGYLSANKTGITPDALIDGIKSPDVRPAVEAALGGAISEQAYDTALNADRPLLQAAYDNYFEAQNVNAVIFPTTPITARPIEGILEGVDIAGQDQKRDTFQTYIQNTDPGSLAGIPGITLPIGDSGEGLPIGIALDGPAGSDEQLLSIALALEAAL